MNIASVYRRVTGDALTVVEISEMVKNAGGRIAPAVEQRIVKHNLTGIHCINLQCMPFFVSVTFKTGV